MKANAVAQQILLKKGEFFLEYPDSKIGKGPGRIIVGDGETQYQNLDYNTTATNVFRPFITDPEIFTPRFENTTPQASSFTYDWNATTAAIDSIGNGSTTSQVTLPTIIGAVKKTLCLNTNAIAKLNNDLGNYVSKSGEILVTESGNYLYKLTDNIDYDASTYRTLIAPSKYTQEYIHSNRLYKEKTYITPNYIEAKYNVGIDDVATTASRIVSMKGGTILSNISWDGNGSTTYTTPEYNLRECITSIKTGMGTYVQLLDVSSFAATATDYTLGDSINNYTMLSIEFTQFANVWAQFIVSVNYFKQTGNGSRPQLTIFNPASGSYEGQVQIYKKSDSKVTLFGSKNLPNQSMYHIRLYGIGKINNV
jgi:hypothetical protein